MYLPTYLPRKRRQWHETSEHFSPCLGLCEKKKKSREGVCKLYGSRRRDVIDRS